MAIQLMPLTTITATQVLDRVGQIHSLLELANKIASAVEKNLSNDPNVTDTELQDFEALHTSTVKALAQCNVTNSVVLDLLKQAVHA